MKARPKIISLLSGPAFLAGRDGEAILAIKDTEVWLDESGLNLALPRSMTLRIAALGSLGELFLYIGQRRMSVEVLKGCVHPTDRLEVHNGEWTQVEQHRWFKPLNK